MTVMHRESGRRMDLALAARKVNSQSEYEFQHMHIFITFVVSLLPKYREGGRRVALVQGARAAAPAFNEAAALEALAALDDVTADGHQADRQVRRLLLHVWM